MSLAPLVIPRLKVEVPALHNRVEPIGALSDLIARKQLPKQTPAAWVVSIGEDAAEPVDMTGAMRQLVTETIGVVLIHRVAGDGTGAKAEAELDDVWLAVRDALAGWEPVADAHALEYRRRRTSHDLSRAMFVQLDFLARFYLRIEG